MAERLEQHTNLITSSIYPDLTGFFSDLFSSSALETVNHYYILVLPLFVILMVGFYRLFKNYKRPPGQQFKRDISEREAITILMHPNPDPDAMASAIGIAEIANSVDTDFEIQYSGQIRHQENRAFRTVLEMDCEKIETVSEITHEDSIVLVDHNTPRGFTESEKVEPIAVVDHHPGNGTGSNFTDIRESYGATATIITEYFLENNAPVSGAISEEKKKELDLIITPKIATGLTYGIQADTKQLTHGCIQADFNACSTLFPGVDEDLLNRVANPEVSHDVLRVKATAINEIQIEGAFGICNVGEIDSVDSLSQAADELMRIEGVTAVIIYGQKSGILHLSGRSYDDRVHMGECLRQVATQIEAASAGGHARMGGGQIPVGQMNTIEEGSTVDFTEFNDRLFAVLNGDY